VRRGGEATSERGIEMALGGEAELEESGAKEGHIGHVGEERRRCRERSGGDDVNSKLDEGGGS
jgi:hypothetical protein